jgi:hypothetical protein
MSVVFVVRYMSCPLFVFQFAVDSENWWREMVAQFVTQKEVIVRPKRNVVATAMRAVIEPPMGRWLQLSERLISIAQDFAVMAQRQQFQQAQALVLFSARV